MLLGISFLPVTLPEETSCGLTADECSDDSECEDVSVTSHEQGKITTRAGRVVKRVNCLIETMAQKPFKMPNLSNKFLKKSQSFLSLF